MLVTKPLLTSVICRRQNTVESPKGKHFKLVRGNNNIRRSYDKHYISLLQKMKITRKLCLIEENGKNI